MLPTLPYLYTFIRMSRVPQPQAEKLGYITIFSQGHSLDLRNPSFAKFSLVSFLLMVCNQCYPTNIENSST